jgi:hypothetical protein
MKNGGGRVREGAGGNPHITFLVAISLILAVSQFEYRLPMKDGFRFYLPARGDARVGGVAICGSFCKRFSINTNEVLFLTVVFKTHTSDTMLIGCLACRH